MQPVASQDGGEQVKAAEQMCLTEWDVCQGISRDVLPGLRCESRRIMYKCRNVPLHHGNKCVLN